MTPANWEHVIPNWLFQIIHCRFGEEISTRNFVFYLQFEFLTSSQAEKMSVI